MGHTLNEALGDMYAALDIVSRERTGFIHAVSQNHGVEKASVGQLVQVPIVPEVSASSFSASMTPAAGSTQTITNVQVQLDKNKVIAIPWEGEEQQGLANTGTYESIRVGQYAQAIRSLINGVEADVWADSYKRSSRAFGSAGTAPFNTADDLSDFAGVLRILEENGAPLEDLQLVLGHAAVNNLRAKQKILTRVNEAGSPDMLRNGMTDRVMGFALRHSHAIGTHTKGAGTSYVTNSTTTNAIGDTVIPADTGSGAILAGDIVTFADESPANKYVVNTALSGGSFAIGKPGLRNAVPDGKAITVGATYTPNLAFARSSIVLATRAPYIPRGGDAALDREVLTDPRTGLSISVALYGGAEMNTLHFRLVYGSKVIKPEHVATLLG